MSEVETVRIFLASPSADTMEARARVVQVVNEISADPQYAAHVRLDLRRWDDPARPVVCDRAGNPQQDIVKQVSSPGDCELVIGIFAHTMGGTLPVDRFPIPKGRRKAWHCSEWEVEQGLLAKRAVWVLHDQRPLMATTVKAMRESLAVSEYIERHSRPVGPMREGFNPFKDLDDLAGKLRHGLRDWLSREFIDPPDDRPPSPGAPGIDLRPYLQRRSEQWRTGAGGRLDRCFVNLKLMVDHGLAHEGPRHEVNSEYDLLATLLAERQDVGAWVLVGDPGSGKSTLLQHHEMTTAEAALAADAGVKPEVCVWRRLSEYSHDSLLPADWLALHWPDTLPPLDALRGVARVRFLLDGLNEIKAPDREKQLEAIDRWTEWSARLAHHADHLLAPIFSVRTLDQSPLSKAGFEVCQIIVIPRNTDQIRQDGVSNGGRGTQQRDGSAGGSGSQAGAGCDVQGGKPNGLLPTVIPFRWACAYGEDRTGLWQAFEVAGVRQVMRWIAPGEFLMGSPETEAGRSDDERQHRVVLTEGFWMADTACTQALWMAVMGENPSQFKDDPQNPVEQVSWLDITDEFLPKLNALASGLDLVLPTEAQWEYACRAGTTTPFSFGEQITPEQVNYKDSREQSQTIPVKALPANPWGLYQMHGNVREWCEPVVGEGWILKGGGAFADPDRCRSAARNSSPAPEGRRNSFGFRLARRAG